jgi:hypothetical protein
MKLDWSALNDDISVLPRILYFEEFPDPAFRFGLDEFFRKALFFTIPLKESDISFKKTEMANVSLEQRTIEDCQNLVLTLKEDQFSDQFDDLIIDIVWQCSQTEDNGKKDFFISLCNKWFEFLQPAHVRLSSSDLKGIFGELTLLNDLLDSPDFDTNCILDSWKGPFGKGHDFELGQLHIEVKSIESSLDLIHISSEYQLDFLEGQRLVLCVMNFSNNPYSSQSVSDLVNTIITKLRSKSGVDIGKYYSALRKTGLSLNDMNQYDSDRFFVSCRYYYDSSLEGFPSIRRINLADDLLSVNYSLSTAKLEKYQLTELIHLL